ncbi:MGMT family protein [Exilibacterium tricleocarpae]|uniref:MGMT family protein n=1 Tax=Exilibacterium tricleocarpae TaxID=2591008 RepID=A0A545TQH3_9GAMM|nr:MGMT family protein [Exilibacterium tricleocarpae]TQV79479.1 MGMT family protein [Exilibacterium tricleocarpae]
MTDEDTKRRIYQVVSMIPPGRVATYGQVAELAGLSRAARLVGTTMSRLPKDTQLPWHRVINSQGRLSLPPDSPGYARQKDRLQREGVEFIGERLSLRQFRWQP